MKLIKVKTGWRILYNRVFSWMFSTGSSLCPPLAESQLTLNSSLMQVCLPPGLLSDHLCVFLSNSEVRFSGFMVDFVI